LALADFPSHFSPLSGSSPGEDKTGILKINEPDPKAEKPVIPNQQPPPF
jgi:hypothetical protein